MAFFKFRKSSDGAAAAAPLPDSPEAMRRRAKYRLIGAAVLVLIGVVGFPLLFDKQPRPMAVDMPIDIPERGKAKPLNFPTAAASAPEIIEEKWTPEPAGRAQVAPKLIANPGSALATKPPPAKTPQKPASAPTATSAPAFKPIAKLADGDKVKVSQDANTEAVVGRFVVQVGAFSDPVKARETRLKLEYAGLKTYTHVAETKDGPRTRVRLGPFSTKAEADKAAQKVKALKLAAAILTL